MLHSTEHTFQFIKFPSKLLADKRLSLLDRNLILFILKYSPKPCFASHATIASHLGIQRETVLRRIKRMVALGLILQGERHGRSRTLKITNQTIKKFLSTDLMCAQDHIRCDSQITSDVTPRSHISRSPIQNAVPLLHPEGASGDLETSSREEKNRVAVAQIAAKFLKKMKGDV